jgi:apolipoprotein N-acyltransferase
LALLISVTAGQPPHVSFRRWLLGGLVTVGIWFHWLPQVAARHLDVSLPTALLVTALAVVWDAFRFGVFGFLIAVIGPRGRGSALAWPALWVALEWPWPHLFPWRLGHFQLGCLSVCQIGELTGVCGVSFLVLWGAAAAALAWREPRQAGPGAAAFLVVLAICLSWGWWRMRELDAANAGRPQIRFALVQPGARDEAMTQALRRLSLPLANQANVVVWGEGTIGDFAQGLTSFHDLAAVRQAARFETEEPRPCPGLGRALLCGGGSFAPGTAAKGPYSNTAYLIAADEQIVGRYDKRVLMPWGEYAVGQQWLPGLRGLLSDVEPWVAGESAAPLELSEGARLGVLICYEDMLPGPARQTVQAGAGVLVNVNNLSTFERTAAVRQHQLLARFRTIENRRWLVRCGTVGSTAVISATGRVTQQLAPSTPATAIAVVPLLEGRTVYTNCGDVFAMLCAAVSAVWLARIAVAPFWPASKHAASADLPAEAERS